jgi:MFS transporter, ACS family, glucarate transporter
VHDFGWRLAFAVLMLVGLVWAMGWLLWFRDNPADHSGMTAAELKQIQFDAPAEKTSANVPFAAATLLRSRNLWLAMAQYFCSNFTFFFCMTWLYPHLKKTFQLEAVAAGWYAAAPLIAGALGNILAGWLTDRIYRAGRWKLSRQAPAMLGFLLAALGLVVSVYMTTPLAAVAWLSVAIFGADMTLAPSWAFCIDIGRRNSGAVSGTMNMAGNIGSFLTSLAFPYLLKWTGTVTTFFFVGAALNGLASLLWCFVKPERPIEEY